MNDFEKNEKRNIELLRENKIEEAKEYIRIIEKVQKRDISDLLKEYSIHINVGEERMKFLLSLVDSNYGMLGNFEFLKKCSDACKSRGKITPKTFELLKNGEVLAFLPIQEVEEENRKYVEGYGSFMIEAKEIFGYEFEDKEVLRKLIAHIYGNSEFELMFGNVNIQIGMQKRFNYYSIKTEGLNDISDYFNKMTDAKKRQGGRRRYKKISENEDVKYEVNLLDNSFDIRGFLNRGIELAKKKGETNLIGYGTDYEFGVIKAHIENGGCYEMKLDYKGRNICHYLISIIGGTIHEITGYYDNFDFEFEDKKVVDQATKYLIYKRIEFAIEKKIPIITEGPGNFGWKNDYCDLSGFVYFNNIWE